jgi:hypothetical protein
MARFTTFLGATTLAVGLAPWLATAQTTTPAPAPAPSYAQPYHPAPTQPYEGRLILDPKRTTPLVGDRGVGLGQGQSLNLDPAPGGSGGLRFLGSEARISPTLTAPTANEAPVTDRATEARVPGFRLKVPW